MTQVLSPPPCNEETNLDNTLSRSDSHKLFVETMLPEQSVPLQYTKQRAHNYQDALVNEANSKKKFKCFERTL